MKSVEKLCLELHRLLSALPVYYSPSQVPFSNGLYFFYEKGEVSEHGPSGRIVRVGNHPRSSDGLIRRLRLHYSGNKNSSVFRRLLGGALMRRADLTNPCLFHWEKQGKPTCEKCKSIEGEVSILLRRNFWFRCVEIRNRYMRNMLEGKIIATISLCPICRPSETWLGNYAYSETVKRSGLWNIEHTFNSNLSLQERDLDRLKEAIISTKNMYYNLSRQALS